MENSEYEESYVGIIKVHGFEDGMEGVSTFTMGMTLSEPQKLELSPNNIVVFLEENSTRVRKGSVVIVQHFERLADWYNYKTEVGDWYLDGCDPENTPTLPDEMVFIAR